MKLLVAVILLATAADITRCHDVEYYEKLLNEAVESAKNYEFAEDASEYQPKDGNSEREDIGTYDFIVVGAGPTGGVLANRLSEIQNWTVLLLDAGEYSTGFNTVPGFAADSYFSSYNWRLQTTPQKTACLGFVNGVCNLGRNRGIGGGSIINGLFNARGTHHDWNRWADMGNEGWSYWEVLPYFKKSERFRKKDPNAKIDWEFHGFNGLLSVENPNPENGLIKAFIAGHEELGYHSFDVNGHDTIGVTPLQLFTRDGKRQDIGNVFIKPFLNRKNLKVLTRSYVTKVHIEQESKVAKHVEFSKNNKNYLAQARNEIIISSGTYGSPHILMHSGVGPSDHLKEVGIPLVQHLEVGSYHREHTTFQGIRFSCNSSFPIQSTHEQLGEFVKGTGTLTFTFAGASYFKTSYEKVEGYPDMEYMLFPSIITINRSGRSYDPFNEETSSAVVGDPQHTFNIFLNLVRQYSTGTVRLKSNNPYDFPLVDLNILSDPDNHDMNVLYESINQVMKLVETNAFKKINAKPALKQLPQCSKHEFMSKDYWFCAMRYLAAAGLHPSSTCPMGPDPSKEAVVDARCRVHGVKKLRVADASIFPFTLTGHPMSACVMIGEKLADILKKEYNAM